MKANVVIHLPGLRLAGGPHALGGGKLRALPFAEWYSLDGAFRQADRQYSQTAPVFWQCEIPLPDEVDEETLLRDVSELRSLVHLALLLTPSVPLLPTPALSITYLRLVDERTGDFGAWARLVGPFEREWIVYGSPLPFGMDSSAVAAAEAN